VRGLFRREALSLPRSARMNIQPLLDYAHPVTVGAKSLSPDAAAWLIWESSWRGLSTLRQLDMPPVHIQSLTVKWWTSAPESLRFECAEWLFDALRDRTANLYRFWQCVVQRMRTLFLGSPFSVD
jgi:hypothetical protein